MLAERYSGNPVLQPTSNWWESRAVFNCAVAEKDGKIHMLYRALGDDNISRFGHAWSVAAGDLGRDVFDSKPISGNHHAEHLCAKLPPRTRER